MGDHVLHLQGAARSGQMQQKWRTKRPEGFGLSQKQETKGTVFYDSGTVETIQNEVGSLSIQSIFKSPSAALARALECPEQGEHAPSVPSEW